MHDDATVRSPRVAVDRRRRVELGISQHAVAASDKVDDALAIAEQVDV
jgi:hypothetical protein